MTNQIIISGNLGSDPETKDVKGYKLTTFQLAHTPKKKQGDQWIEGETIWFRVVVWGDKGESIAGAYGKGTPVHVIGTFNVSTYVSKDGTEKTSLEINANEVLGNPMKTRRPVAPQYQETPGW